MTTARLGEMLKVPNELGAGLYVLSQGEAVECNEPLSHWETGEFLKEAEETKMNALRKLIAVCVAVAGLCASAADDTAALQELFAGEGDVVIPAGNYTVSGQLTVDKAATVRGATGDPKDVVITLTGTAAQHLLYVNNADAVVSGLTLVGGQGVGTSEADGYGRNTAVVAGTVSNCVIRGATLSSPAANQWTTAVWVNGSSAVLTHCVVSNNTVTGTASSGAAKTVLPGVYVNNGGRLSYTLVAHNRDVGGRDSGVKIMKNATVLIDGGSMDHCTVAFNRAPNVGGVRLNDNSTATKCVLIGNKSGYRQYDYDEIQPGSAAKFTDCVIAPANPWELFVDFGREDLRAAPGSELDEGDIGFAFVGADEAFVGIRVSDGRAIVPATLTLQPAVKGVAGVAKYRWDFGDGSAAEETAEMSVTHEFMTAGRKMVTLSALDAGGAVLNTGSLVLPLVPRVLDVYDYPSLQAAIDYAVPGATVELAKGDYPLSACLRLDRGVCLRGATGNPNDVKLLNGLNASGLELDDKDARVEALTFEGTANVTGSSVDGAAFHVMRRGGAVSNCVVRNFTYSGGVSASGHQMSAMLEGVYALMTHCAVTNISMTTEANSSSSVILTPGVTLRDNARCENSLFAKLSTTRAKNLLKWAGAVYAESGRLLNVTIADVYAAADTAGLNLKAGSATNCVFAGNASNQGKAYNNVDSASVKQFYYCASDDDTALGSTCFTGSATELFRDFAAGDYSPSSDSPLKNHGCSSAPRPAATDLKGNDRISGDEIDMGCYELDVNAFSLDFAAAETDIAVPGSMTFTARISGFNDTDDVWCYWDFNGDGVTDLVTNERTAVYDYDEFGRVSVSLTVTNATTGVTGSAARANYMNLVPKTMYFGGGTAPEAPYDTPAKAAARLQDALDVAVNGVTVLVTPGEYDLTETIAVERDVVVRNASGDPEDVKFLQKANATGFYLNSPGARLENVVVEGAVRVTSTKVDGVAVWVDGLGGTVSNCVFRNFVQGGDPKTEGGDLAQEAYRSTVYLKGSSSLMTHSVLTNVNSTSLATSSTTIRRVPGVALADGARLENSLIANIRENGTTGQGMKWASGVHAANGRLLNCTVVNCFSGSDVAGVYLQSGSATNCVIAGNVAQVGPAYNNVRPDAVGGFRFCATDDAAPINASCLSGVANNFFRDFPKGDYTLGSGSPLKDVGCSSAPTPAETDLLGNARVSGVEIDIGCYEFDADSFSLDFEVATAQTDWLVPATVAFVAHPSILEPTDDASFYWDFDADGVTDLVTAEPAAVYGYTEPGKVSVALAFTNRTTGVTGENVRRDYLTLVPPVIYVDAASMTPVPPYVSPQTAASNVQDAVDVAVNGVTVLVSPGLYELTNAVSVTKGVTVRGKTERPEDVRFVNPVSGRNFYLNHQKSRLENAVLECGAVSRGEARNLLVDTLGGTVSNCVCRGGSIFCGGASPMSAGDFADFVVLRGVNSLMTHCVVTNNSIGGICRTSSPGTYTPGVCLASGARVENTLVAFNDHSLTNTGYSFHVGYAAGICGNGHIVNCTVVSNVSVEAGGICFHNVDSYDTVSDSSITNTVVAGNVCVDPEYATRRAEFPRRQPPEDPDTADGRTQGLATHSVFGGDVTALFKDFAAGNYIPRQNGALIGGGTLKGIVAPSVDLLGRRRVQGLKIDIGAIEGDPSGLTVLVR